MPLGMHTKAKTMVWSCTNIKNRTNDVADASVETAASTVEQASDHVKTSFPHGAGPSLRRAIVPVASIRVEDSFGRELDDAYIGKLAAIVTRYGLRHPITVTPDLTLLAGHPWLAAVQRLGHRMVEVVIVEVTP